MRRLPLPEGSPLLVRPAGAVSSRLLCVLLDLLGRLLEHVPVVCALRRGLISHPHKLQLLHVVLVVHVIFRQLFVRWDLGLFELIAEDQLLPELVHVVFDGLGLLGKLLCGHGSSLLHDRVLLLEKLFH